MDRVNTLRNAYEFIVTFLETMVESTVDVQKENQTVLRREKGVVCENSVRLSQQGVRCIGGDDSKTRFFPNKVKVPGGLLY